LRHRRHAIQHLIEVVDVDVDEVAVLEALPGGLGIAAEVAEHADHERQLLVLDRVADLDVVGHLHARRAYLLQAFLHAFILGHVGS
jgi:hypothetical protein